MPPKPLALTILPLEYSICRLPAGSQVPAWAQASGGGFISITRTPDELSIVAASQRVPPDVQPRSDGWRCLKVNGPLDFAWTGVLSSIAAPLAQGGISLLAFATFDTDYILVRDNELKAAVTALEAAGHRVVGRDN